MTKGNQTSTKGNQTSTKGNQTSTKGNQTSTKGNQTSTKGAKWQQKWVILIIIIIKQIILSLKLKENKQLSDYLASFVLNKSI